MIRLKSFQEEIISSSQAVCYHRTQTKNLISIIKDVGFAPGKGGGAMYGAGFYFTYDLESQMNPHMEGFGPYIIKAKVPLKGFLIFDKEVAEKVYGNSWDIPDQLNLITKPYIKLLGGASTIKAKEIYQKNYDIEWLDDFNLLKKAIAAINKFKAPDGEVIFRTTDGKQSYKVPIKAIINDSDDIVLTNNDIVATGIKIPIEIVKQVYLQTNKINFGFEDYSIKDAPYPSSKLAIDFYQTFAQFPWYKDIKGLMYEGQKDGKCVVVYDYKNVIPLSVQYPPTISFWPKDDFRAFVKKIESIFTEKELDYVFPFKSGESISKITSLEDILFDRGFAYHVPHEKDFELFFPKERVEELRKTMDKYNVTEASFLDIIQVYARIAYLRSINKSEEMKDDYTVINIDYFDDDREFAVNAKESIKFMYETQYKINDFMGKDYMLVKKEEGEWKKLDLDTLKHFIKHGIKKGA